MRSGGDKQIIASRYKLHLPTEQELAAELQRERQEIELTHSLTSEPGTPSSRPTTPAAHQGGEEPWHCGSIYAMTFDSGV